MPKFVGTWNAAGLDPITIDTDTKGGLQVVDDASAKLSIEYNRRKIGMRVVQADTQIVYRLINLGTSGVDLSESDYEIDSIVGSNNIDIINGTASLSTNVVGLNKLSSSYVSSSQITASSITGSTLTYTNISGTYVSGSQISGSNAKILTSLSASEITASFISGTQITGSSISASTYYGLPAGGTVTSVNAGTNIGITGPAAAPVVNLSSSITTGLDRITGVATGSFTQLTGTTTTGTLATFITVTGSTGLSGALGLFPFLTGTTATGSTLMYTTVSGTYVSGTQISGSNAKISTSLSASQITGSSISASTYYGLPSSTTTITVFEESSNIGSTFNTLKFIGGSITAAAVDASTASVTIAQASAAQEGVVSTGTQTFGGNKTFNNDVNIQGNATIGNAATDSITMNAATMSLNTVLNIDSNTVYIDGTNNRTYFGTNTGNYKVGINAGTASADISGALYIEGNTGVETLKQENLVKIKNTNQAARSSIEFQDYNGTKAASIGYGTTGAGTNSPYKGNVYLELEDTAGNFILSNLSNTIFAIDRYGKITAYNSIKLADITTISGYPYENIISASSPITSHFTASSVNATYIIQKSGVDLNTRLPTGSAVIPGTIICITDINNEIVSSNIVYTTGTDTIVGSSFYSSKATKRILYIDNGKWVLV